MTQHIQVTMTGQIPLPPYQSVYWTVVDTPDPTGAQSGYGANYLINIGVSSLSLSGTAVSPLSLQVGGDLLGYLPNPNVVALQGHGIVVTAPTIGQALVWNGSLWSPAATPVGFYGDGSSGAFNLAGGTTTLTADLYCTNLNVALGATLITAGHRIFATLSITNAGTISSNGGNASGSTGGVSLSSAGSSGGTGNTSTGAGGGGSNTVFGGAGGNGGSSLGTAGGSGRTASVPFREATFAKLLSLSSSGGGGGGSGAGGGSSNTGGGGGAGADYIVLCSPIIINTGTISATGGNGGNGSGGNTGGGAGGGGGIIYLIGQVQTSSGTLSMTGGLPGAGTGAGNAGLVGQSGSAIILSI